MGIEMAIMNSALSNPVSYKLGQWDYVAGTYNGYPMVVCRTEQGLANTGAATALAMEIFSTSGGHDPALHTYDIVLCKRTVNYCTWKTAASAKGAGEDYTVFEMNGVYAYDRDEAAFTQSVYHYADTPCWRLPTPSRAATPAAPWRKVPSVPPTNGTIRLTG